MTKHSFNIIIPIYKELTETDKVSISSLCKVLLKSSKKFKYPLYVICPTSKKESIKENFNNFLNKDYNVFIEDNHFVTFQDTYFESVSSYSKLLLTSEFYKTFFELGFEYSYIFQLDCYLFRDELAYWANLGYDYIGPPIMATNSDWGPNEKLIGYVGNGGFSLRNNKRFMEVFDENGKYKDVYKKYNKILKEQRLPKNTDKRYIDFEDIYICRLLSKYIKIYIPFTKQAAKFAMDRNPWTLPQYFNVPAIPMCAHNWILFYSYWYDFIPELKENKEALNYCKETVQYFKQSYHPELEGYGNR